jgi:hypothetical protein
MTPSHQTQICLTLFLALVVAVCRADANSGPDNALATATPASSSPSAGVRVPMVPTSSAATPARFTNWGFLGSDAGGTFVEPALVIPDEEIDAAATSRIVEDLSIMSRIIEKNVLTPYGIRQTGWRDVFVDAYQSPNAGPRAFFSSSLGRPKPLYIGGYGATFFIQVDFPLLPPADQAQEQRPQTQEDPVWAQTRQSLREPRPSGMAPRGESGGQPYNQGKVDSFRRSLIATMKHAANIRVLEGNEWLTFVIQGLSSATADPTRSLTTGRALPLVGTSSGRSVMTLRATKADVDAYAKGQLSQEQFEQRVQVTTY